MQIHGFHAIRANETQKIKFILQKEGTSLINIVFISSLAHIMAGII